MQKTEKVKNQHYVPLAYLKFFSRKVKEEYYIAVMDKNKDKIFMSNIKNVASGKYFYEVKYKPQNHWEKYYCKNIESKLPVIFNNIISVTTISQNYSSILNESLKEEMARIILSQISRTRKAKEFFDEIGNNIKTEIIDNVYKNFNKTLSEEQKLSLKKIKDDNDIIRDIELDIINGDGLLSKGIYYLMDRIWVIYKNINYRECPFITSDHPVVYYNYMNSKTDFKSNGIALNTTVIEYPINRELLLVLYPKNMYFELLKDYNNRIIFINENEFILRVNRLQYEQSYRQAYFTFFDSNILNGETYENK